MMFALVNVLMMMLILLLMMMMMMFVSCLILCEVHGIESRGWRLKKKLIERAWEVER
jgi:hypothetical protein